MKAIRPWLLGNLKFSWLRVLQTPALDLHEGNFKLQPKTFSMDEKTTWGPPRQILVVLQREFFLAQLLKIGVAGCA